MPSHVTLRSVGTVPADATVCDYDELDDEIKHRLPDAVDAGEVPDGDLAEAMAACRCDVVRFTEYYRIS